MHSENCSLSTGEHAGRVQVPQPDGVAKWAVSLLTRRHEVLARARLLSRMAVRDWPTDEEASALFEGASALRAEARSTDDVIIFGGGLLCLVEP